MVSEIYLPQKFFPLETKACFTVREEGKALLWGDVDKLGAKGERPFIEASDSLVVGDHAAQFSSQPFDFGELLSDTFKQC